LIGKAAIMASDNNKRMSDAEKLAHLEENLKDIHSNLDGPIFGGVVDSQCDHCKLYQQNIGNPEPPKCDYFNEKAPIEYGFNDEPCPYRIPK
jgi:hypothetical protein